MPYRFGKKPAPADWADRASGKFAAVSVTRPLPTPPSTYSVLQRVEKSLERTDIPTLFPMDHNDTVGDCTCAGVAHAQTVYRGLDSALCIWGPDDVEKFYFSMTGGQDTGLYCVDVLHHWNHEPINGDRLIGYVAVNPANHEHVRQAIQVFGGLYIGFMVTDQCIQQFDAHLPWTPGNLIQEGHCVFVTDYDQNCLTCLTWGATQQGTWAWWDQGVDEAYALVPPEAADKEFSPGYTMAQLIADMQAIKV